MTKAYMSSVCIGRLEKMLTINERIQFMEINPLSKSSAVEVKFYNIFLHSPLTFKKQRNCRLKCLIWQFGLFYSKDTFQSDFQETKWHFSVFGLQ